MTRRKPFLLRIDPEVLEALQKWADQELRSLNGQIEFVLRRVLIERGRMRDPGGSPGGPSGPRERSAGPGK